MIEIKKDIPAPDKREYNSYPFAKMDVGDCFDAPIEDTVKIRPAATYWSKRHATGVKFTIRVIRDEGVVRCWRLA